MQEKLGKYLYAEFISGRKWFDWLFLALGIGIQIVVYLIEPASSLSLVSGIAGIISVILCSQGKISTFLFGIVQISTYLWLSLQQRLYAEVGINVFYFVSQLFAVFVWIKNYHITSNQSAQLKAKRLSAKWGILIFIAVTFLSLLTGYLLKEYTDDTQPYLDAFTTIPAIAAQILLVLAMREQWILWLIVDVLSAIMWWRAGDYCLFAQYLFWCVNCVYGYNKWIKLR